MAVAKKQRGIPISEVPRKFDDNCIRNLATTAELPSHANFECFAKAIRDAATIYANDAAAPTVKEKHHEVRALYKAASLKRPHYREVATLLDGLSAQTRDSLNDRSARLTLGSLPTPAALLDRAHQKEACGLIVKLCRVGIRGDGRVLLHVPDSPKHFKKLRAEERFVIGIRLAWLHATGEQPPMTAYPGGPGPFAKMVQTCFELANAHADAVGAINRLATDRNEMNRRHGNPSDPYSAN
jgi:hypothetical protein